MCHYFMNPLSNRLSDKQFIISFLQPAFLKSEINCSEVLVAMIHILEFIMQDKIFFAKHTKKDYRELRAIEGFNDGVL